jgi:branched-chain amino acid aminotransferase
VIDRIWMNGSLVAASEAHVSVLAHSMQRGSLVFDVAAFHATDRGPAVFRMREHVARFLRSARLIGLDVSFDAAALEEAARACVRARGATEGLVRWSAFFASIEAEVVPREATASVAVAAYAPEDTVPPGVKPKARPASLRVRVPRDARKAGPEVFPPQAKVAASYLGPMLASRRARAEGFDEVVLLDGEGRVAEAPTANVFAVIGGALVTPPLERVLAGITRDSVIAIAREEGIHAREEHFALEQLAAADEAFLAATSYPIAPIASVDETILGASGARAPGPITARIAARIEAIERGRDARSAEWLSYVE